MAELIADLSDSGIKSSVLSAAKEDDLLGMLEHFEIKHLFDHVFGVSDHLAHGKISRGLDLLKKINLPTSQLVLVGDTDHDAEVAEALGVDAILLDGGHQCPDRLSARKLHVLRRKSFASLVAK
jgi:phosphoglycolate phosphatase